MYVTRGTIERLSSLNMWDFFNNHFHQTWADIFLLSAGKVRFPRQWLSFVFNKFWIKPWMVMQFFYKLQHMRGKKYSFKCFQGNYEPRHKYQWMNFPFDKKISKEKENFLICVVNEMFYNVSILAALKVCCKVWGNSRHLKAL